MAERRDETERIEGGPAPEPAVEEPSLRPMPEGRYREFHVIGTGGMGTVYRAVDEDLNRRVALKCLRLDAASLPKSPLDITPPPSETPDAHSFGRLSFRLLQEAWITGALEHPGIVPVHEVGRTPAGVPYYTMRYVPGDRTLRTAIDEARTLDDRLALLDPFLRVCDTVAFAHANGVIHRDLKPANVALGAFGEVVVLDWGVAKLAGRPDAARDFWQERLADYREARRFRTSAALVGTVGFLAPEAAVGEPERIDERSDVYSLGVILFRILTGRLPHRFGDFREFLEKLLTLPAPAARSFDPAIPSVLSGIAARALARAPEERYASAGELAEAVRRWQRQSRQEREIEALVAEADAALAGAEGLAGEARLGAIDRALALGARVLDLSPRHPDAEELMERARTAREDSIRARERTARRRLLRSVAVLVLGIAAVGTLVVAGLLDARRREAVAARAEAEDLAGFMLFDLHDRLAAAGRLDILDAVARRTLDYYERRPETDESPTTLRRQSLALAQAGEVLRLKGDLDAGADAVAKSLAIARRLLDAEPDSTVAREDYAVTAEQLGGIRLRAGDLDGALARFEEARAIFAGLPADGEDGFRHRANLATSLNRIGDVLARRGDEAGARERYGAALAIRRELAARPEAGLRIRADLASSLEHVGRAALAAGDRERAFAALEEGLELRRSVARDDPGDAAARREVSTGLVALGDLRLDDGDPDRALAAYREAVAIDRAQSAADPENTSRRRDLSISLNRVSTALRDRGELEAALEPCREALAIRQRLATTDPTNLRWQRDLASSLYREGRLLQLRGELPDARKRFEASLPIRRELVRADDSDVDRIRDLVFSLLRASEVAEDLGFPAAARDRMAEAVDVHRRAVAAVPRYAEDQRDFEARLAALGEEAK